jgi:hypothetical protein
MLRIESPLPYRIGRGKEGSLLFYGHNNRSITTIRHGTLLLKPNHLSSSLLQRPLHSPALRIVGPSCLNTHGACIGLRGR